MEENSSFFSRAPAPEVGNCCVIPECALRPLVGEASQFLRALKIDLLDMDDAIPEAALRPSKGHLERRWTWRTYVKSAETIYEVLMALQAAALLPSAFAIPKGKSSVSLKDSFHFGISLSDHVKVESSSSALRFKVPPINYTIFFPSFEKKIQEIL
ncbi:methyl-CpG-binding domain-containing protein 9-like isoform X3 [Camellia sinensis]|uniref:methyl-CpG-binding domain-containing protein 9-like isoform X3 n=1 Tax=Camellia sinensis TaxID=4442 RepID=UPI0010365B98|nr:methyl-CpG-binding domain-containing protein 9-like isoform X3 [Camellia sinensis]